MKFLTKEWYHSTQLMDFHLDVTPVLEAERFSETYYSSLFREKLENYLETEREIYDEDPRTFLSDASLTIGEEHANSPPIEDTLYITMSDEELQHYNELIDAYDQRPEFPVEEY